MLFFILWLLYCIITQFFVNPSDSRIHIFTDTVIIIYDCASICDVAVKDMGKIYTRKTLTMHKLWTYFKGDKALCKPVFYLWLDTVPADENVYYICRQTSNIRHTLVGNKIVDHSDVVGASFVGAAPTTSSFST